MERQANVYDIFSFSVRKNVLIANTLTSFFSRDHSSNVRLKNLENFVCEKDPPYLSILHFLFDHRRSFLDFFHHMAFESYRGDRFIRTVEFFTELHIRIWLKNPQREIVTSDERQLSIPDTLLKIFFIEAWNNNSFTVFSLVNFLVDSKKSATLLSERGMYP